MSFKRNPEVLKVSIDDTIKLSIHELAIEFMRNQSLERTQEIYDAVCKMFIDHHAGHLYIFNIENVLNNVSDDLIEHLANDITYDIDDMDINEDEVLRANYEAIEKLKTNNSNGAV